MALAQNHSHVRTELDRTDQIARPHPGRRSTSYVFERMEAPVNGSALTRGCLHEQTIFQTPTWLAFLSATQHGEPIVAALRDDVEIIGTFSGLLVRKFGILILGSPFPGWTTDYMGLTLAEGVSRSRAVQALFDFAFRQLGCLHVELMDRYLSPADLVGLGTEHSLYHSFEIDLTPSEDNLFAGMSSACRRCIRKAQREGVSIEVADDLAFADEYHSQLCDVFAKQSLVPPYGVDRVRTLITHLHPTGHLLLLRARDPNGRCIATGIFPHMYGAMYFWGGASWRHSQLLRPNELLQWHAMQIGRAKGVHRYDMGGDGEYKRKYGGVEITVPWVRKSRYPWLLCLRHLAEAGHRLGRRCKGRFARLRTEGAPATATRSVVLL